MDLGAIERNPENGQIFFSFSPTPRKLQGMAQLLQSLVIELMSDPRPEIGRGSGFVSILRNNSFEDQTFVASQANRALDTARGHLLQFQANDTDLRDTERLLDVRMRDLFYQGDQFLAELELKNVAGTRFVFTAS